MNQQESGPSTLFYGLGALIILAGIVAAAVFMMQGVTGLAQLAEGLDRLVAPGSMEVEFKEPGGYTVFYEHTSVVEGKVYRTGGNISGMQCRLISSNTGEEVALSNASGRTSYNIGSRHGYSLMTFTIDAPGTYVFSAQYSEGTGPQVVLAVGRALPVKAIMTLLSGIFIFIIAFMVGALIIVITLLKRHAVRKRKAGLQA